MSLFKFTPPSVCSCVHVVQMHDGSLLGEQYANTQGTGTKMCKMLASCLHVRPHSSLYNCRQPGHLGSCLL